MIGNVVHQVCAIDYLISKYTFLLINKFIKMEKNLIDEDISLEWGCWAVAKSKMYWLAGDLNRVVC